MFKSFEEFLTSSSSEISTSTFILDILLTALLTALISKVYQYYGTSLSNRKLFSKNFILIATTTMLIITVVKSSLALSLGLVGALSIIRFRTAVKEPEELAYLFLIIAIGLGFGANQRLITITAILIIIFIIIISKKLSEQKESNQNLYLILSSEKNSKIDADNIIKVLEENCNFVRLNRLDETKNTLEASFLVDFESFEQLNKTKEKLYNLDEELSFSFLENKGIN